MKLPSLSDHQDGFAYLESRSQRLYSVFIVLIFSLLFCMTIWTVFAEFEQTLRATAVIRPMKYSSALKCNVSAHVTEKRYISSDFVKKGDILVIMNHEIKTREVARLQSVLDLLQVQKTKLNWYAQAIQNDSSFTKTQDVGMQSRLSVFKGEAERKKLLFEQSALRLSQEQSMPERLKDSARIAELSLQTKLLKLEHETVLARELVTVLSELETIEQTIKQTEHELSISQNEINNSFIIAPIDGIVEDIKRFTEGEYIFSGEDIIRITPGTTEIMLAEMEIPNEYIGKIKPGMVVSLQCNGYKTADSFKFTGIIRHLSADSGLNPTNPTGYIAEILVDTSEPALSGILKGSLMPGMQALARVSLGRERFFFKLVEMLGFGK